MNSILFKQLNYDKAYRRNRLTAAQWVLDHPVCFEELLAFCFAKEQNEISHKAAWVLEFVCLEKLSLLYSHIDYFVKNLSEIKKHQSLRSLSHICELLAIAYYKNKEVGIKKVLLKAHKVEMTECCFDWLISDQKVACKVRAMTVLYYLGTEIDWIHAELLQIIKQGMQVHSAAYKARGKHILMLLNPTL